MNGGVKTFIQNIGYLQSARISLLIPSYQRPYVWSEDDVIKLLNDIVAASEAKEPHYYIGTIVSSSLSRSPSFRRAELELIDGQQRMTTLILLSVAFAHVRPGGKLGRFALIDSVPRLKFAIRDNVQSLFELWTGIRDKIAANDDEIASGEYTKSIYAALVALENRLRSLAHDRGDSFLEDIEQYIVDQVQWVNNVMPRDMDVNRLFTTMNTGGIQLEQSDILKSLLLKKISQDRHRYDAIWQACENMGNYFERNVRKIFSQAKWDSLGNTDLAAFSKRKFSLEKQDHQVHEGLSISELAERSAILADTEAVSDDEEVNVYCRSTISFSLLLVHALRIFLHRSNKPDIATRVIETQLSKSFLAFAHEASEDEVIDFIECLWEVRYQFDQWIVKWVRESEEEEEHLRLSAVSWGREAGGYRLKRTLNETSNLSQLQSVRYFSGERSAQYWLTSFLGRLLERPSWTLAEVEHLLEGIDNQLSLTTLTQKEASFALLGKGNVDADDIEDVCTKLSQPLGTAFEHYWFQKIEYILWRNRKKVSWYDKEKLRKYRITSKNSVEHVHAQNERRGRTVENLDMFGNLALLSPGENSSFGNKSVEVKRSEFNDRPRYESLKLAHIFNLISGDDKTWNDEKIASHQQSMLTLLRHHYG
ncbi:DUF262 domain-containing protein [Collimonas sp. OK412]|jgi:uncharacterized protein with ParB-like and HNH nuclease domain|uniref:DUF262 domain-containing protein n=1 Tax=Collimonas sp. (strain OK412) TaxID=1801619 RepID=UPI0008F285CB|nr:DUF262 domain-containing protein [Collimonas sp. OK412]SFC74472.1 Uncharacterized conserved protein, contains ParB-like and HNH nuclease domains [Collimonas sp. OK412]